MNIFTSSYRRKTAYVTTLRNTAFVLLLIGTAFSSVATASGVKAALCDYCSTSQARQLALTTAGSAARFGVTVFIADFNRDALFKFFLLENGNPQSPYEEPKNFIEILEQSADYADILDQQVINRKGVGRFNVTIAQLQPTLAETQDYNELDTLVDFLESQGIQTRNHNRGGGGPPVVANWNVPAGVGYDSAFDVIDFVGRQRLLGNVAINAAPFMADALAALAHSTDIANIKVILNLTFAYKFHFPDGTTGLFAFNNQDQLEGVPGSWQDAELNDIPQDANDVPGMSSFFQSSNSSGFNATRERVLALGYGVTGGGSGGAECRFVCSEESCTVTCRIE